MPVSSNYGGISNGTKQAADATLRLHERLSTHRPMNNLHRPFARTHLAAFNGRPIHWAQAAISRWMSIRHFIIIFITSNIDPHPRHLKSSEIMF